MARSQKASDVGLVVRLRLGDDAVVGPGKIALLESVDRTGSISAAARRLGMSYRQAWFLLETLNEALAEPVVRTTTGGRSGGGAVLTTSGRTILELYRKISADTERLVAAELAGLRALLGRPRKRASRG